MPESPYVEKREKMGKKTGMVSRSLIKDATKLLPKLPETYDFAEIKKFIVNH